MSRKDAIQLFGDKAIRTDERQKVGVSGVRRLMLLAVMLAVSIGASAIRYTNPILHHDWSDPDVCRVGNDFYMTAS